MCTGTAAWLPVLAARTFLNCACAVPIRSWVTRIDPSNSARVLRLASILLRCILISATTDHPHAALLLCQDPVTLATYTPITGMQPQPRRIALTRCSKTLRTAAGDFSSTWRILLCCWQPASNSSCTGSQLSTVSGCAHTRSVSLESLASTYAADVSHRSGPAHRVLTATSILHHIDNRAQVEKCALAGCVSPCTHHLHLRWRLGVSPRCMCPTASSMCDAKSVSFTICPALHRVCPQYHNAASTEL
jgi:hypothetical protein